MFKVTKTQWSIEGRQNEYICTSNDDIAKLPRFGIPGTQETNNELEEMSNEPCMYGSIAILLGSDGSSIYMLGSDNVWTLF